MTASATIQHVTSTGTSASCDACVSLYSRDQEPGQPTFTESMRFRLDGCSTLITPGDTVIYNDLEFIVKTARQFNGACRTVVDAVRVGLCPSLIRSYLLYEYQHTHGPDANEKLQQVGTVEASEARDSQDVVPRFESRSTVARCRLFMDRKSAERLTGQSVLVDQSDPNRVLKIVGVYDLAVIGKMPWAIAEITDVKFAG